MLYRDVIFLVGIDNHSWGLSYTGILRHAGESKHYTSRFFDRDTIIGVKLNLYDGTLTYFKSGECLGVAFTGLNQLAEPLFPLISSTAEDTELEVVSQKCRYQSLEHKCLVAIARRMRQKSDVSRLPLPLSLRKQIEALT